MHPDVIVRINNVRIAAAPDRILPAKSSSYRSGCIPDLFAKDPKINGVESIEKRDSSAEDHQSCVVDVERRPVGVGIYAVRSVIRIRQPHDCCFKGRIDDCSSSRWQRRGRRHWIRPVIMLDLRESVWGGNLKKRSCCENPNNRRVMFIHLLMSCFALSLLRYDCNAWVWASFGESGIAFLTSAAAPG